MSLYWKCQIAGWWLYVLVAAGIPTLYNGPRAVILARALVGALLGVVLTHQLRQHMHRHEWLRLPVPALAVRIIGASLIIAAAIVIGVAPFLAAFFATPLDPAPWTTVFLFHAFIVLGWILIYHGYRYLQGVRRAEADKWRLEVAARETELRALRTQLNPHFLFNSLNSLRGLVTENPEKAQDAITGLAALLRHTLQLNRARTTTLDRELEATEHYLELEALRFESRLQYAIEVDPHAREHLVPPMLVQTLVENAIKHGIAQLPDGGTVRVEARKSADILHLRVTNTGRLRGNSAQRGIGLTNSLDRLRLVFGDQVRLDLTQSDVNEVTCEVLVPSPAHGTQPLATQPSIKR
jgi:two-component sensor histidine kinase